MDSKKIACIVAVAVVVIAGCAAAFVVVDNNNKKQSEEVEVSIAYLNLGYYPFMVGFENGWFDNLGFKVKPVVVSGSGNIAVEAMLNGEATMAATGDGPFATTFGKYPNDIVGLCQYTQSEGSLAGHSWIAKNDMKTKIDPIQVENNVSTNSQTVANQIKDLTSKGEGKGPNGMFAISMNKGSTTHTNFMKWCIAYGLTYTSSATEKADVYINAIPSATADILQNSLDTYDAVACNKSLYSTINSKIGDKIYKFGDSSSLKEASYSVLCTTQKNYEKYSNEMMKILEVLKQINEWIEKNVDETARICSALGAGTEESIKDNINSTMGGHKVVWDSSKLDGWVSTAKINGYTVTVDQFTKCCPHRDIINGWYA